MQNPYLQALQVGSQMQSQTANVASRFMNQAQQSVMSGASLALKMNALLEQEEARKRQEQMQSAQLLNNVYQNQLNRELKEQTLKEEMNFRNKQLQQQEDLANKRLDQQKYLADRNYNLQLQKLNEANNVKSLEIKNAEFNRDMKALSLIPQTITNEYGMKVINPDFVKSYNLFAEKYNLQPLTTNEQTNQLQQPKQNIDIIKQNNTQASNQIEPIKYLGEDNYKMLQMFEEGRINYKNASPVIKNKIKESIDKMSSYIVNNYDPVEAQSRLKLLVGQLGNNRELQDIVNSYLKSKEFQNKVKQDLSIKQTITSPITLGQATEQTSNNLSNYDASINLNGSIFNRSNRFDDNLIKNFGSNKYGALLFSKLIEPLDASTSAFAKIDRPMKKLTSRLDEIFGLNQKVNDKMYINSGKVFVDEIGGNRFEIKNKQEYLNTISKYLNVPNEYIDLVKEYEKLKSKHDKYITDYSKYNDTRTTIPEPIDNTIRQKELIGIQNKLIDYEKQIAKKALVKYDNIMKSAVERVLTAYPQLKNNPEELTKKAFEDINENAKYYGFKSNNDASNFFLYTMPLITKYYAPNQE